MRRLGLVLALAAPLLALLALAATLWDTDGRAPPAPVIPGASADAPTRPVAPLERSLERELARPAAAPEPVSALASDRRAGALYPPAGRGAVVAGVLLGHGQPLVGIGLELRALDDSLLGRATTNSQGEFALECANSFSDAELRGKVPGFAPLCLGPLRALVGERRYLGSLSLDVGLPLHGEVVDATGAPVRGATVSVKSAGTGRALARAVLQTTSAADGSFTLQDAPRGAVHIEARAAGHGSRAIEGFVLPSKEKAQIELSLEHGLDVQVLDPAGRPLPGASVVATAPTRLDPEVELRCDAQGWARLRGLGGATWNLRASARGFRPEPRTAASAAPLAAGEVPRFQFVLRPWPCLRGTVLTADGSPPPPGSVVLAHASDSGGQRNALAASEPSAVAADGSFAVCDLRPGHYVIEARAPDLAPSFSRPAAVRLDEDSPQIDLFLLVGGSLRGRLACEGASVAGARVELWDQQPARLELLSSPEQPLPGARAPLLVGATDSAGAFALEHLPQGDLWLLPRSAEHPPRAFGPFRAPLEGKADLGTLTLEPGARLFGKVLDREGRAVPGALVVLSSPAAGGGVLPAVCDENGAWRSHALLPGSWSAGARPAGNSGDTRPSAAGVGDAVLVELVSGEARELVLRLP